MKTDTVTATPAEKEIPHPGIECHPLTPFLPENTQLLMLGSFPPSRRRWCMEFFYPNFTNDMWRIFGLVFFGDKDYFVDAEKKTFRKDDIIHFLKTAGIGLYDTALVVCRTKNTASDKDLDIIETVNTDSLLKRIPHCHTIVTTGEKATNIIAARYGITAPGVGETATAVTAGRTINIVRMPSSSRAYPVNIMKKAEFYSRMFENARFKVHAVKQTYNTQGI